jgi:predicted outer membrane repeat protein
MVKSKVETGEVSNFSGGRRWSRHVPSVLTVGALLGWSASAQAGVYNVYTSNIGAMTKNANDGYCSLAEAVDSVNAGTPQWNCTDAFPGSGAMIQFWEAPGKPFASYPFVITSLNITADVVITGSAYVNSTSATGWIIGNKAAGKFPSVELAGMTMTFTGANGGRHIENYGTLWLMYSLLRNGNVASHPNGTGGAVYNEGTIASLRGTTIQNNRAKRGGAIYNKDGEVTISSSVITGNTATMAGGGIYNMSTGNNAGGTPKGHFTISSSTITFNTAKAGGGIFNRGDMDMTGTSITFNTASGTGSNETCHSSLSCDGFGGGLLTLTSTNQVAAVRIGSSSSISNNTASERGGAVYNTGQLNSSGITISSNKARFGGAIFAAHIGSLASPQSNYCEVTGNTGASSINSNSTVPSGGYSIVDSSGAFGTYCLFITSASGNASPRCNPAGVRPGTSCPQ